MYLISGKQVKSNYMVIGIHYSTRKFIDINLDIDILNYSQSIGSRDVEKVRLYIKIQDGIINKNLSWKKITLIRLQKLSQETLEFADRTYTFRTWKPIAFIILYFNFTLWCLNMEKHMYDIFR